MLQPRRFLISKALAWASLLMFAAVAGCSGGSDSDGRNTGGIQESTTVPGSVELSDTTALDAPFASRNSVGTMVIRRLSDGHEWVHAPARADSAYTPASTFKIPNSAIALETGVVSGPDEEFPWDGVVRANMDWNKDHTLASAIAVSAVPVYQRIARSIGPERMSEWLDRIDYGNADIGGGIDQFWLTGDLRISANQQVDFLTRFISGETPFSPRTVSTVSDIILLDQGPGWELHGKTGWSGSDQAIGWLTGWTRMEGETYVFAINMVMPDATTAPDRVSIAREGLVAVGALPASPL